MVGSCDGIKDTEGEMEDDGPVLVDGAMESVGAMDTVGAAEGELVGAEYSYHSQLWVPK